MSKIIDLAGQRFGRLLVAGRGPNTASGKCRFRCVCDCGTEAIVSGRDLRVGHTKSCGCLRVELPSVRFKTHGMRRSAEYRIWTHIKTRCLNPKSKFFARYGGRGIRMCDAWANSFEAFYRDMGKRPSPKHSIDRIDNDGDYESSNCRWATQAVQSSNRSTVKMIEHGGIKDTIAGWSRMTGIPYLKLRRRLVDGWPIASAIEAKDAAVRAKLHPGG